MPTMIVKQEVEATPALVIAALQKFALPTADQEFPYAKGSLIMLQPQISAAVGGVEGMPALVLMTGKGSLLGMVAIHKADGDITVSFVGAQQVEGLYTPTA